MADKRMFSKKMISSDAFLDMPLTTQGLFFHLAMRADDEGIVDCPNRIVREVKATKEDLDLLIKKRYILTFPSGVILIKHWKIHNYIAKDRFTPSTYTEELSTVCLKSNKSYTERIQNIDNLFHQSREDKNSEEERRKDENAEYVFDMEKAWDDTFGLYPKKSSAAVAKQFWLDKLITVIDSNRADVAQLIYLATKLYVEDHKSRNPDDTNFKYIPKYCDWLKNDCDYWMREVEKKHKVKGGEQ